IALRDASVEQGASDSMADAIELGIRPPNIAANDRVLVRDAPGRAPENFADVLLPDHVGSRSIVHCCLLLALHALVAVAAPPTGETYRNTGTVPDAVRRSSAASSCRRSSAMRRSPSTSAAAVVWTE